MKKMSNALGLLCCTLLISFALSSCATRQSAVNDLERFSIELRDNSQYYNAKQWKKAVTKFGKLRKEIANHKYSPAERKRIGQLEGDCARHMVGGVKGRIDGLGSEIQGVLDAIGLGK